MAQSTKPGKTLLLPPPLSLRARVAHGLAHLGALLFRPRTEGPVPPDMLLIPRPLDIATSNGATKAFAWGDADGHPVLLLHGLNANAHYWLGTASLLASDPALTLIAPDLPGHGESGPIFSDPSLDAMTRHVVSILDTQGISKAHLVGHSWGGKIALNLAASFPERVTRLALVDPVPPTGLPQLFRALPWVVSSVFSPERGPFPDEASFRRAMSMISWLRLQDPWAHKAFRRSFTALPDGSVHPALSDDLFQQIYGRTLMEHAPRDLTRARMPALLVLASFSVMPQRSQLRNLQAQLPQLEVVHLPGEHSLHITNPVGLARVLKRFLTALA